MPIRVLMVTGAYPPEPSGGGLQCQQLIKALGSAAACRVLTTSTDATLPATQTVDGVSVERIYVTPGRMSSELAALWRLAWTLARCLGACDVVHMHGVSRKLILIRAMAAFWRKPLALTLHTAGHDEPETVRAQGAALWRAYRRAAAVLAASPLLEAAYRASGLPIDRFVAIPNGVDTEWFRPVEASARAVLRRSLGLDQRLWILFVGFFSQEKGPHRLFEAWARIQADFSTPTGLIFIGATKPGHAEIDPSLIQQIRAQADASGLGDRLVVIERTDEIERYDQAADLFVLPSTREAMPMALLEAMACGLACVACRLPGSTDTLIEHRVNGWLVAPEQSEELSSALRTLLTDAGLRQTLGRAARQRIASLYTAERTARRHLAVYQTLRDRPNPANLPVQDPIVAQGSRLKAQDHSHSGRIIGWQHDLTTWSFGHPLQPSAFSLQLPRNISS